jgi:DNA-binding NarL/FixJ family response regulator
LRKKGASSGESPPNRSDIDIAQQLGDAYARRCSFLDWLTRLASLTRMPNSQPTPTVRWIGPTGGDDIGPCWRRLNRDAQFVETNADLTVLACPRPLVETATAQALLEEAGADHFVQLLGVWCEGEGRTGKVVTGAERVFWHAWPAWQLRWLESRTANATASPLPQSLPQPLPKLVRIDTPDGELAKALVASLAAEDIAAVWSRTSLATNADAIVWDGAQLSGREADHLGAVCWAARHWQTPVIALLDFPRPETVAACRTLGAAAVLGKPFTTELLLDSLSAAMREATDVRRSKFADLQSRSMASRRRESSELFALHSDDSRRRLATY